MASNNALSTALALASSKTNWTAIVPARAPPPPPPSPVSCSICGEEEGEVGTITVCGRDIEVCENCDKDGDNYDGFLDQYDFCAETSSYEEGVCAACGTSCLDHTSNNGRGSESPCGCCEELRCKYCPCECDDGPEHDICCNCGKFEDTGNVCDCGGSHRELCDECKEEKYAICEVCGIDECVDYGDKLCHGCYHKDVGASECWCAGEGSATTDRARDALKRWAEKEEVKKYKAVLAETLRFEAIMDMMKSGDA